MNKKFLLIGLIIILILIGVIVLNVQQKGQKGVGEKEQLPSQEGQTPSQGRGFQKEQGPIAVEPTSDFGIELDNTLKSIIKSATNFDIMLTYYNETKNMNIITNVIMRYKLSSPIGDISAVTQSIENELSNRGFSNVYPSKSINFAQIGFRGALAGKYIETATISIHKNFDNVLVFVIAR